LHLDFDSIRRQTRVDWMGGAAFVFGIKHEGDADQVTDTRARGRKFGNRDDSSFQIAPPASNGTSTD
jgi:hypothetical protein